MRYKSWPYYEVWQEIFGKDRANGEAAEDLLDAYNAIGEEDISSHGGTRENYEFTAEDAPEKDGEGNSAANSHKSAPIPKPRRKKC